MQFDRKALLAPVDPLQFESEDDAREESELRQDAYEYISYLEGVIQMLQRKLEKHEGKT